MENDLDLLGVVAEYLEVRERFVASHPLCARMDRVLASAFTEGMVVADREMLDCQRELLADPERLAEAFPLSEIEVQYPFFTLWGWVSNDTVERFAPEESEEVDYQFWRYKVSNLLSEIQVNVGMASVAWNTLQLSAGLAKVLFYIISAFFAFFFGFFGTGMLLETTYSKSFMLKEGYVLFAIFVAITTTIAVVWGMAPRVWRWLETHLLHPFYRRIAQWRYRKHWRPSVAAFLERSSLDYFVLRALIAEAAESTGGDSIWIHSFVNRDVSLAIYSYALRFRV